MADHRSPVDDGLPVEYAGQPEALDRSPISPSGPSDLTPTGPPDHSPNTPTPAGGSAATAHPPPQSAPIDPEVQRQVDGVLKSEVGPLCCCLMRGGAGPAIASPSPCIFVQKVDAYETIDWYRDATQPPQEQYCFCKGMNWPPRS